MLVTLLLVGAWTLTGCGPGCDERDYYADRDGDGYGNPSDVLTACERPFAYVPQAGDCDDADADVRPDTVDTCNGRDDDCDGVLDEDQVASTWFVDADGDGYGGTSSWTGCGPPPSALYRARASDDCDDFDPETHPGATERCNGMDNDCDGQVDEDAADRIERFADLDGDGFGVLFSPVMACPDDPNSVDNALDCNDAEPDDHAGALELCDGRDNDCNGFVDDNPVDGATYFFDYDGDGWGGVVTVRACAEGPVRISRDTVEDLDIRIGTYGIYGYYDDYPFYPDVFYYGAAYGEAVVAGGDCSDARPDVFPGADEICNGTDDNCNGLIDDNDPTLVTALTPQWWLDLDGDLFGRPDVTTWACTAPPSFVSQAEDCDDDDGAVNPDADEVCNGEDDDCDDLYDDEDPDAVPCD